MPNDQMIRISPDAWKVLQHTKAERRGTLGQLASAAIVQHYGELTVVSMPLRKARAPAKRKKSK